MHNINESDIEVMAADMVWMLRQEIARSINPPIAPEAVVMSEPTEEALRMVFLKVIRKSMEDSIIAGNTAR